MENVAVKPVAAPTPVQKNSSAIMPLDTVKGTPAAAEALLAVTTARDVDKTSRPSCTAMNSRAARETASSVTVARWPSPIAVRSTNHTQYVDDA